MRRLFAALVTLVLVPLGAAPAQAATNFVTVDGFNYPSGLSYLSRWCGATEPGIPQALYRAGGTLGTHATGLRFGGNTLGERGVTAFVPTPSAVTGISFDTMHPAGPTGASPGHFYVEIDPSGGGFQTFYYAVVPLNINRSTWGEWNVAGVELDWYFWDGASSSGPHELDTTISQFAQTYGNGSGARVGFMFGCDGRDYYMDDFEIVAGTDATVYDFEGVPSATYISGYAQHHSEDHWTRDLRRLTLVTGQGHIVAGDSGTQGDGVIGNGWFDGTARLYAKGYGQSGFSHVDTKNYTTLTYALFAIRPAKNTVYLVDTPGTDIFEASTSLTLEVQVKRRVKARVADTKIFRGRQIKVTGWVKPRTSGVRVSLQRKTSSGWRTITKGRTGSGGAYSFSPRAGSAGTWVLRVRSASGKGNLGNVSPNLKVSVKVPPPKPPPREDKTPVVVVTYLPPTHEPTDEPKAGRKMLRYLYQQLWGLGVGVTAPPASAGGTSTDSVSQQSPW